MKKEATSIIAVFSLIGLSFFTGCGSGTKLPEPGLVMEEKGNGSYQNAISDIQKGDFRHAISELSEYLSDHSDDARA